MKTRPRKVVFVLIVALVFSILYISSNLKNHNIDSQTNRENFQQQAQQIANECERETKDICYRERFSKIAESKGFKFAESTLFALWDIDPFTRSCHVIAHKMTEGATRKDPKNWKKLIDQVDVSACGAGFLHGILEAHISLEPDFKVTSEVIDDICKEGASERRRMCSHFLAHILVLQNDGKIEDSFPVCNGVKDELKFECFDGIFMEDHQKNIIVDHGLAKTPEFTDKYAQGLAQRCDSFDGVKSSACWTEMAEIFAKASSYNQERVFEGCAKAEIEGNRVHCYLKGVVVLVTYPIYDSLDKIKGICDPYEADKGLFGACLNFAISALMNYSIKFADRGVFLCSNISEEFKKDCFKNLGEQLKMKAASLEEREALCKDAQDTHKKLCAGS